MSKIYTLGLILVFCFQNISSQTIVRMEKINGVYQIPCKVNGISMNFIFDTGASDISISTTEANFLVKQGLLTKENVIGSQNYMTADGSIVEGTKILLNEVRIKDLVIKNVSASVIDNINSPLLFGQSALERFGKYEIEKDVLRLYPSTYKNNYKFLDIDLTKEIGDFGLSGYNLLYANPLLSTTFEDLKISKDHIFKNIDFDEQNVLFNKKGKIEIVVLKLNPNGEYKYEKDAIAKEKFEDIVKIVNSNFSMPISKMTRNSEWKSADYFISLNIESDYSVLLIYVPKIIHDVSNNLTTNNSSEKDSNSKEKELKDIVQNAKIKHMRALEVYLQNKMFDVEVMCKNDDLIIKFYKRFYEEKFGNNAIESITESWAYTMFTKATQEQSWYDNFTKMYNDVVFEFDCKFANDERYLQTKKISNNSIKKLGHPINEERFKRFLE